MTGIGNWEYTEVESGLAAGDRVILSVEQEGLRPGRHVRVHMASTTGRS